MKLVKIRFTNDAVYRVHGYMHPDNPVFKTGTVHVLRQDEAQRWLKRGVAEYFEETKKPEVNDGNDASAIVKPSASKTDGDNGGDKSAVDKRQPRKGFARDN